MEVYGTASGLYNSPPITVVATLPDVGTMERLTVNDPTVDDEFQAGDAVCGSLKLGAVKVTNISADAGLAPNSDFYLPTQKATKAYVDNKTVDVAHGGLGGNHSALSGFAHLTAGVADFNIEGSANTSLLPNNDLTLPTQHAVKTYVDNRMQVNAFGGTGQNSQSWNGIVSVSSGTWSASTTPTISGIRVTSDAQVDGRILLGGADLVSQTGQIFDPVIAGTTPVNWYRLTTCSSSSDLGSFEFTCLFPLTSTVSKTAFSFIAGAAGVINPANIHWEGTTGGIVASPRILVLRNANLAQTHIYIMPDADCTTFVGYRNFFQAVPARAIEGPLAYPSTAGGASLLPGWSVVLDTDAAISYTATSLVKRVNAYGTGVGLYASYQADVDSLNTRSTGATSVYSAGTVDGLVLNARSTGNAIYSGGLTDSLSMKSRTPCRVSHLQPYFFDQAPPDKVTVPNVSDMLYTQMGCFTSFNDYTWRTTVVATASPVTVSDIYNVSAGTVVPFPNRSISSSTLDGVNFCVDLPTSGVFKCNRPGVYQITGFVHFIRATGTPLVSTAWSEQSQDGVNWVVVPRSLRVSQETRAEFTNSFDSLATYSTAVGALIGPYYRLKVFSSDPNVYISAPDQYHSLLGAANDSYGVMINIVYVGFRYPLRTNTF